MPPSQRTTVSRVAAAVLVTAAWMIAGANSAAAQSGDTTQTSAPNQTSFWSGDFTTGAFSPFLAPNSCPGGVTLVPDPTGSGRTVAKFTVSDGDTKYKCSQVFTPNPAAGLNTPTILHNGGDAYISFSTLFPAGFPAISNWFQFAEIYGPPYGGSPTIGFDVQGNRLGLWRDRTHNYDNPWRVPIQPGAWENIVAHVKFSSDPSVGFVEIWLNGVRQTFTNGSQRLYYATLVPGINWTGSNANGDFLDLDQYRSASPALGTVTIYHGPASVSTTSAPS